MPKCEDTKHCPLLNGIVDRRLCFEITEVVEGDRDWEFTPIEFDMDKAKKVCPLCGWKDTPIE